jgi:hypothetical protein
MNRIRGIKRAHEHECYVWTWIKYVLFAALSALTHNLESMCTRH